MLSLFVFAWVLGLSFFCAATDSLAQPSPAALESPQAEPVSTTPPRTAPGVATPETAARAALAALALRENTLQIELGRHSLVGPALAVGVGVPVAAVTLPIGGLLFSVAGSDVDGGAAHERRVGAGLLSAGVLAFGAVIYGAIRLHKERAARQHARGELQAIAIQRLVLESAVAGASATGVAAATEQLSVRRRSPRLTARGRVMLTGGIDVGFATAHGAGGNNQWRLNVSPGFAYFTHDGLAFGAFVDVSRQEDQFDGFASRKALAIGVGLRMIYEVRLGERAGLWLWPYVGYSSLSNRLDVAQPQCEAQGLCSYGSDRRVVQTSRLVRVGLLLPLMYHVTENWAFGAGPRLEFAYAMSGQSVVNLGLASQLIASF